MPAKAVVTGVVLVIMIFLLVFMVEYFVPLSAKSDFDIICRSALLKMETEGGLSDIAKENLISKLTERGFSNISVNASASAKQGEYLEINVRAEFEYTKLFSYANRGTVIQVMVYNRYATSRKVVN
jgi:hypothetical protein